MKHHDEPFHVETVDEHIEWLAKGKMQDQPLSQAPGTPNLSSGTSARLVHDLRTLEQHDARRLARIRERLASHVTAAPMSTSPAPFQHTQETGLAQHEKSARDEWGIRPPFQEHAFVSDLETQEISALEPTTLRSHFPGQTRRTGAKQLSRWTQALAAVLILGMLVGGLITVLAWRYQGVQGTPIPPACQPSPWKQYDTRSPDLADTLTSVVAVSANDAWAVGASAKLPPTGSKKSYNLSDFTTLIEHWDGKRWQIVQSPNGASGNGRLIGVAAVSANDVWAVGSSASPQGRYTLIEHWNGRQWSVVSSPNGNGDNELNAVAAVSANDVWAVGRANSPLMEHWDGKTWSIVPGARGISGALADITVISAKDIWAVGTMQTKTKWSGLIEHWDGMHWTLLPSPPTSTYLIKVSALSTHDVWILEYAQLNPPVLANQTMLLEHWDGHKWDQVPAPQISPNDHGELSDIAAVAPQNVWAVGFTLSHGLVIAHWDGKTWQQTQIPMPLSLVGLSPGIAVSAAHQIWVVGSNDGQGSSALIEGRFACP